MFHKAAYLPTRSCSVVKLTQHRDHVTPRSGRICYPLVTFARMPIHSLAPHQARSAIRLWHLGGTPTCPPLPGEREAAGFGARHDTSSLRTSLRTSSAAMAAAAAAVVGATRPGLARRSDGTILGRLQRPRSLAKLARGASGRGQPNTAVEDALAVALQVAEQTKNVALRSHIRAHIDGVSLSREDVDLFDRFFRSTEAPFGPAKAPDLSSPVPGLDDSWLGPLLSPAAGPPEDLRMLAAKEGVRWFDVSSRIPGAGDVAEAAARHIHEHGFAVLVGALGPEVLRYQQRLSAELIKVAARAMPNGNRGFRRYSLGRTTVLQGALASVDSPAVLATLRAFWRSDRFSVQCAGGDFSLPGAEVQELHIDMPNRLVTDALYAFHDPVHPGRSFLDLPAPALKVYFPMVDFGARVGPPRFVPGSHWRTAHEDVPPPGAPEPPSVRTYCPQGSAIIMDQRIWHGGTPNASAFARPMLSLHFAAPWYNEDMLNDGGGMQFYRYHKGAVQESQLAQATPAMRRLLRGLGPVHLPRSCCTACGSSITPGRTAVPGLDDLADAWLCLACFAELQRRKSGW